MDINRFRRLNAEGMAFVLRGEENYISFKRFNPENGKELEPELQLINVGELQERKKVLAEEIDTIKSLLSLLE
jgi:hypothetical protein